MMHINTLYLNIRDSAESCLEQYKFLTYAIISDILLFFVYGLFTKPFFNKILDYATAIASIVSESSGEISRSYMDNPSIVQLILSNPEIVGYLKSLTLLLILAGFIIYLLYSLFHGFSWWCAYKIKKEELSLQEFLKKFFLVNIPFIFMYLIYNFLSFFAEFQNIVAERAGVIGSSTFETFLLIFLIVIIYFSSLSYSQLLNNSASKSIKKGFYLGFTKIHKIFLHILFVIGTFYLINKLLIFISTLNSSVSLTLGVFLIFPIMTFMRVFVINSMKNGM